MLTYAGNGILTLSSANTFTGGLTINAGKTVLLNAAAGAGTGTVTINGNGALTCNVAATYANAITGGSTSVINVTLPAGNSFLSGNLSGFSGTVNCNVATTSGQLVINSAGFSISSAATWNIANGSTLLFQGPFLNNPASVTVNGVGNNQVYGALRIDNGVTQSGNVLLNGPNVLIGNGGQGTGVGASTISGVISDGGHNYGFTKVGNNANQAIVLSGVNTYTGPTTNTVGTLEISGSIKGDVTVTGGILKLDTAATLASTATLYLASAPAAGTVNLAFSGTQPINALYYGATQKASGTWGATGSGATHQDAAFTGTGILSVATGTVLSTTNVIQSITNNANGTFTLTMLGTPAANYYLVANGSVTAPMSAWTPLVGSTNSADGTGHWSFVVSNAVPAYYRSIAVNPAP